jgi:pimeloyl-ACP methyl ester carboxylesterase
MARAKRKVDFKPEESSLPLEPERQASNALRVGPSRQTRQLNALPDVPDIRDRFYEPPLIDLRTRLFPTGNTLSPVLDQGPEGSCTGFALASAINLLLNRRLDAAGMNLRIAQQLVSPRMIYEMARIHDEWPGEAYEGSSLRGALKGFFNNGVCTLAEAPYKPGEKNWRLTVSRAKDARNVGLGAYYRLRPQMIDYHAALNQTGVIYVSADVHGGWENPDDGAIKLRPDVSGGHAFIIVGYDENGFLIQNSWGTEWGGFNGWSGIAHWSYRDWSRNVRDAWALRLAVPTPEAFDLTSVIVDVESAPASHTVSVPPPRREDILGHFAHIDDGKFVETGRYATSIENIEETAKFLTDDANGERKYRHLLFYAHGGLNNDVACAHRIAGTKKAWKENGVYPFHFMWETGLAEELKDVLAMRFAESAERVGGVRDFLDMVMEKASRGIGLALWREMKADAERAFAGKGAGLVAMAALIKANEALAEPRPVHLVGHSAGAILIAEMLRSFDKLGSGKTRLASVSLMAPACTMDLYRNAYGPALKGGASARIQRLVQYNLTDKRERDDRVLIYGKSLLYLVSNAFEEQPSMPLLGMEAFSANAALPGNHTIYYAGRDTSRTDAHSHGGFDSDLTTANDILATVLGKKPKESLVFHNEDMVGSELAAGALRRQTREVVFRTVALRSQTSELV